MCLQYSINNRSVPVTNTLLQLSSQHVNFLSYMYVSLREVASELVIQGQRTNLVILLVTIKRYRVAHVTQIVFPEESKTSVLYEY